LQDCAFDACAQNDILLALEQTVGTAVLACLVNDFSCSADDTNQGKVDIIKLLI